MHYSTAILKRFLFNTGLFIQKILKLIFMENNKLFINLHVKMLAAFNKIFTRLSYA